MTQKTCNDCYEFFPGANQCGNPMVYLNHVDNCHRTTMETPACGFFFEKPALPEKSED